MHHIQNNIKIETISKSSLTTNGLKLSLLQSKQPAFLNTLCMQASYLQRLISHLSLNNSLSACEWITAMTCRTSHLQKDWHNETPHYEISLSISALALSDEGYGRTVPYARERWLTNVNPPTPPAPKLRHRDEHRQADREFAIYANIVKKIILEMHRERIGSYIQ